MAAETMNSGSAPEPRTVVIAGSGGVGLYYGARLAAAGHCVRFWARGENLAALRDRGLVVASVDGDIRLGPVPASDDLPALLPGADLLLLAVKCYDTDAVLSQLASLPAGAAVLSLQNGVDNEEKAAVVVGADRVLGGAAFIGSERIGPAHIRHTAAGQIIIGPWSEASVGHAVSWHNQFCSASVRCTLAPDIRAELWRKLLWNIGFNTTTALTGLEARAMVQSPSGEALVRRLMEEALAVAAAQGIVVDPEAIRHYLTSIHREGAVRTSMLVDREKGRRLEFEALCGVVVRRGEQYGVDVSVARTVYALLATVDSSRR